MLLTFCFIASLFNRQAQEVMSSNQVLQDLSQIKPREKFSSIDEFLSESDNFNRTVCKAPTNANWIKKSTEKNMLDTLMDFANSAYPILHEDVLDLCQDFLRIKKDQGSVTEKNLYRSMTVTDLINRLIKKVSNSKMVELVVAK